MKKQNKERFVRMIDQGAESFTLAFCLVILMLGIVWLAINIAKLLQLLY